jgi:hypothetical protein
LEIVSYIGGGVRGTKGEALKGLIILSLIPGATLTLTILNAAAGNWPEVWLSLPWALALNPTVAVIFWLMHRNKERDYAEAKLYLVIGYVIGVGLALYFHFGQGEGMERLIHGPRRRPA